MLPVGPLMVEHRLIERMIALMGREARRIRSTGKVDGDFVLSAVDFVRVYADRCHHGKEEDILFRELKRKPLSPEHAALLAELEAEHAYGRRTVRRLLEARDRHLRGERAAAGDLAALLEELARFYPAHIAKEDGELFLPCMDYFSREELDGLLEEGRDFDAGLVQRLYEGLVEGLEGRARSVPPAAVGLEGETGARFECMVCGYVYDPRLGDPEGRVAPGTPFAELPEGWVCPHCHASKGVFLARRAT